MLYELITDAFKNMITDVHVCMPARIIKYDPDTMIASVQPLIKRRFYKRDKSIEYPVINKVPVIFPRSGTSLIRLPMAIGDIVTLVFADHELSNWVNSKGEAVEYLDKRYHDINDCFAIPGGYPVGKPHEAVNPNALELIVEEGTKITIGNETDELLNIAYNSFDALKSLTERLSDTLNNITSLTVTCASSGSPSSAPINSAAFTATKAQVDSLTTDINTELAKLDNIKV